MKHTLVIQAVTVLLLTAFISACEPTKKEEGSADEARQQNEANLDRDEEKDADFIVNTVSGSLNIIALAQLALKKSTDQEVKSTAGMLEKDRIKILDELTNLAIKKGIATPTKETSGAEIDRNYLAESEGQAFEEKWCKSLVNKYEKRIAKFERRSDKTDDMEFKKWIDGTLPTLKSHLEMLKKHEEKVK
jgi:putative membrane protein